jgi:hypothetical protein
MVYRPMERIPLRISWSQEQRPLVHLSTVFSPSVRPSVYLLLHPFIPVSGHLSVDKECLCKDSLESLRRACHDVKMSLQRLY